MFKNYLLYILVILFLTGCYQSTASLVGPSITLGTSGNIAQSVTSYTFNETINKKTGDYPINHLKSKIEKNKNLKNKKQIDKEFKKLLENHINKTRKLLVNFN